MDKERIIFGVGIIIISALFLAFQAHVTYTFVSQMSAKDYLTVKGRIVFCDCIITANKRSALIRVRYTYIISGEIYFSEKIRYGTGRDDDGWECSERVGRRFTEEHPANGAVSVYYNPKDPNDAILIPGLSYSDRVKALCCTYGTLFLWCMSRVFFSRKYQGLVWRSWKEFSRMSIAPCLLAKVAAVFSSFAWLFIAWLWPRNELPPGIVICAWSTIALMSISVYVIARICFRKNW